MVQRDYAARGKKKKKKHAPVNKLLLLIILLSIVIAFAAGLFLLKEKSTESGVALPVPDKTVEEQPKSTLPSRPEEVWSYIRDLETREIPIDDNPKDSAKIQNLTEEQKQILKMLERDQPVVNVPKVEKNTSTEQTIKSPEPKPKAPQVVDKPKAKEEVIVTEVAVAKPEKKPVLPEKKTESAVQANKTAAESKGKFGLQCGAFKNRQQAENLQAKLVMSGFNARTAVSANWTRVFIGPVGDRAAAKAELNRVKAVASCVVVAM
ncbi:cell division protein FtsN [Spirabiliibacterium falconis]|uniref:cell division protein FtsN n=1 Tax=Spirabiliibacterium falconis TaxID=572023 RepID=UPI001AAC6A1C|nr:cell division protein FtsN [Spirabiliibacterium falconis]MBE2895198.1 cell division protein FtsN [Spirabiliibacterium falconis]